MQLDPIRFNNAFVRRTERPEPPRETATGPVDSRAEARPGGTGLLARLKALWPTRAPDGEAATPVRKQTTVGLQAACRAMGGPLALTLAQETALEMLPGEQEVAAGQAYLEKHGDSVDLDPARNARVDQLWARIEPHLQLPLQPPTLLENSRIGPGMFVGRNLFADSETLAGLPDEVALFYTAHEVGHVEHRDASRKTGMAQLNSQPGLKQEFREATREKQHEMEFAADRRAAEIAAKAGCDPRPILEDLMKEPSGKEHPEGLRRAEAVRSTMAEHGQTVSDREWDALVQRTEGERSSRQQSSNQAEEWLMAFEDLR